MLPQSVSRWLRTRSANVKTAERVAKAVNLSSEGRIAPYTGLGYGFGTRWECPMDRPQSDTPSWRAMVRRGSPVRAKLPDSFRLHVHARPAQPLSLRPGVSQTGLHSLLNQRPLKLGHGADDLEHQPTGGRTEVKNLPTAVKATKATIVASIVKKHSLRRDMAALLPRNHVLCSECPHAPVEL
jgi:hypothetical protein